LVLRNVVGGGMTGVMVIRQVLLGWAGLSIASTSVSASEETVTWIVRGAGSPLRA
jgi:hypothetical protein